MKRTRHKPEQIIKKLREADAMIAAGKTIGQVVQFLEIKESTFHRWRNQYGGIVRRAGFSQVLQLPRFIRRNLPSRFWGTR